MGYYTSITRHWLAFHFNFCRYLVCRSCNKLYAICCPIHSTYKTTTESDRQVDWNSYAIKSFPDVVQLCKSSIPGKKYGVAARQHIPVGTWIGPYEGRRIAPDAINPNMDSSYLWEVRQEQFLSPYLVKYTLIH